MKEQFRRVEPPRHGPQPADARPSIDGAVGIWINKRAVAFLDLPFRHKLIGDAAGWRVEVGEPGKLVVSGKEVRRGIDVEQGDFLLSAGDDIYVGLHRAVPREDAEEMRRGQGRDRGESERA